jgi:hypothetical protein
MLFLLEPGLVALGLGHWALATGITVGTVLIWWFGRPEGEGSRLARWSLGCLCVVFLGFAALLFLAGYGWLTFVPN